MNSSNARTYKELILIGGGHTHALFLSMWGQMPLSGVRVTLVSPDVMTPYSGMLPGLIAGHFHFDETHIDLARLCQYAGARFIKTIATGIDESKQYVHLSGRPSLNYDTLSINSGITPNLASPGAREYAIGVKPISKLYSKWMHLINTLESEKTASINLTVVGGGVAGVELALAIHHRLNKIPSLTPSITLAQKGRGLPEAAPKSLQKKIHHRLNMAGIQLLEEFEVREIDRAKEGRLRVSSNNQQFHLTDHVFWCTQASGASWLNSTPLNLTEDGLIEIQDTLQAIGHENIFACGDCAIQTLHPRPRAGVFAVRQAGTLYANLRAQLTGKQLRKHIPQNDFLSLITGGDQWAVAMRGNWSLPNVLPSMIWRWKKHIDKKFMDRLSPNHFPLLKKQRPANASAIRSPDNDDMRCGGCGAKIGQRLLDDVLTTLKPIEHSSISSGLQQRQDAASFQIQPGKELVQSTDILKQLVSDPFLQGQIAAEHALSDLFAMNAPPHSAQAIITLPAGSDYAVRNDLQQLMAGALTVLNQHNCALIGGHTSEADDLSIGFCVNGLRDTNSSLQFVPQPGDQIILTKPLGTGALFAAHTRLGVGGRPIDAAIQSMLQSNRAASDIFQAHTASQITDVTGFGLMGHLLQILNHCRVSLSLKKIPFLAEAEFCIEKGFASSLQPANLEATRKVVASGSLINSPRYQLLFDPQTSGGLLAFVGREHSQNCLKQLREAGYEHATVIGEILTQPENEKQILVNL